MYVATLEFENFRTYEKLKLKLNPRVNLFLGKNGTGKTNLLEGIYFGLSGEPLRFASYKDLVRQTAAFSRVRFLAQRNECTHTIDATIADGKHKINLDLKTISPRKMNDLFRAIAFTPETLASIKEGPQERRQLLDELWMTITPEATNVLSDYRKCLASRNRVLKDGINGHLNSSELRRLLDSLDATFLPLATEVSWGRIQAVKSSIGTVNDSYLRLLREKNTEIRVEYLISRHSTIDWSKNQVYDLLASRLKELQATEFQAGVTLVGPHKHDVRFLANGYDARVYCSQGQQRSIALAFKVAQVELYKQHREDEPVLLLDDVFSELDSVRRDELLSILRKLRGQIILTAIDDSVPSTQFGSEVAVFHVNKGQVTQ